LIDLHTHTTASDGRCTPSELVERAVQAGIRVLSVTDHDTTAGWGEAAAACERAGNPFQASRSGVRERATCTCWALPPLTPALQDFTVGRLLGIVLMLTRLCSRRSTCRARRRPAIAQALVDGACRDARRGVRSVAGTRPVRVRAANGLTIAAVIARIHEAGGIASLAHLGLTGHDEWITDFVRDGLDAIEAYHTSTMPQPRRATCRRRTRRSGGVRRVGLSPDTSHGGQDRVRDAADRVRRTPRAAGRGVSRADARRQPTASGVSTSS
jgi:predicted metal-dependent phosphoesterase TrpH